VFAIARIAKNACFEEISIDRGFPFTADLVEVFDSEEIASRMRKSNFRSIPEDRLRSRRVILAK
jgi:hypothetical protein